MDEQEFTAFYREAVPGLTRYLTRYLGANDAQEVVAEAMATLWRKRPPAPTSIEESQRLLAFAYAVARGQMRNKLRSATRHERLFGRLRAISDGAHAADPTSHLEDADRWRQVTRGLATGDQLLLALIVDDFSRAEMAAILGCSIDALKMRISRLRRAIKESLLLEGDDV